MDILDTLVSREIAAINGAPLLHCAHNWSLIIKANGVDVKPISIRQVMHDRHYHKSYAETISIIVSFIFSDYQYKILPYRDTLEATLTKIPLDNNANAEENVSGVRKTSTFKAQLSTASDEAISGDNPLTVSKGMSDKASLKEVEIQLISPLIDRLRKKSFGITCRDTDPIHAIAYTLLANSKEASAETTDAVVGIDIDPTFAESIRNTIAIRPMSVVDVPLQIDNQCGGVHPAQMRYFLQGKHWYLYPIYDHSRFSTTEKALTIIKIPKHRLPNIEKTFRYVNGHVIMLCTNASKHNDKSESWQLNDGNGVRFVDANAIMGDMVKPGDNKLTTSANERVTEAVYSPREDESDMVTSNKSVITSNYNEEYAKLALKSGAYVQVVWEHCNIDLLYPGMPVRYLFQDGEKTREIYGTLNAVESLDSSTNNTVSNPRYVTMALLTVFVSNANTMKAPKAPVTATTSKST